MSGSVPSYQLHLDMVRERLLGALPEAQLDRFVDILERGAKGSPDEQTLLAEFCRPPAGQPAQPLPGPAALFPR